MARFRYRAVGASGELVHGEMEAASQATVVERLRGQGHLPLAADEIAAGVGPRRRLTLMQWLRRPILGQVRVTRREVAMMTRELATLLEAGLTLDQALKLLIELTAGEPLEGLLVDLLERIQVTYRSLCQRREGVLPGGVDETRKMEHPQCRRLRRSGAYQQRSV
jgi:general secretion pathway protein F